MIWGGKAVKDAWFCREGICWTKESSRIRTGRPADSEVSSLGYPSNDKDWMSGAGRHSRPAIDSILGPLEIDGRSVGIPVKYNLGPKQWS